MTIDILSRSRQLNNEPTLQQLFELSVSAPDLIAARYLEGDKEIALTYGECKQRALDYACLISHMVGAGDTGYIAIQVDTCPEWFALFWGVIQSGHNALLLDASLPDDMTSYLLKESGAKALITRHLRALPEDILQIQSSVLFACKKASEGFAPVFGHAVALCTSGTTETSRIFVYDETAVCKQVLNSELLNRKNARIVDSTPRRALAFLPLHHVFGFMVNLLWVHFIGYESVYLQNRSPDTILATCQRFGVELVTAVPLLAASLSNGVQKKVAKQPPLRRLLFAAMQNLSLGCQKVCPIFGMEFARRTLFKCVNRNLLGTDVRCVILGGSHTPKEHLKTLSSLGYYTVCGFGMTETAITSVETSLKLRTRLSGSVGRPLDSDEYRVDGDEQGRVGEMFIRGSSLHTGRLKQGELLPPLLDQDGWYRTGDIVRLEKDDRMYVEGRCKDVIINESGENVYPDEIEDRLSLPAGVDQLCVLGTRREEAGKHFSMRRGAVSTYEDITLVLSLGERYRDEAFCREAMQAVAAANLKLPVYKKITRVLATPECFETANGIKVKRRALKDAIESGTIEYRALDIKHAVPVSPKTMPVSVNKSALAAPKDEQIRQRVREIYAETLDLPIEKIGDRAHFIDDLGGDSLQVLGLSLKVEDAFSVLIPPEEYGMCATVNDLTALLTARMAGEKPQTLSQHTVTPVTDFVNSEEYKAFHARQQALLGAKEINPYFVCHESALFDVSLMDGHEVLNFGSYNYVGMSGRPETKEAAKRAIDKYGTSASGSRLLAGEKTLYQALEEDIAAWKHTEAALVLVGGHSTNVTCVGNFCGEGDLILYDALAHNSITQGCRLSRAVSRPFPHNDVAALETILKAQRAKYAKVLIVIEGAYSMDGDIADVPAFVRIKKQYGCFLMVDEAHSACVIGETGGGVDEYFGLAPKDVDIKMGTLSKGLGACGGYLAASRAVIDYMRYNLPGFVFSVGISPPLAAACREALRLLREDKSIVARLHENIGFFVEEAHKRGFNTCLAGETAIIPILVGSDENAFLLSNRLREKGVFVPPAVYPAVPRGKARLRFCVISEHKKEQIIRALDALDKAAEESGIKLPAA